MDDIPDIPNEDSYTDSQYSELMEFLSHSQSMRDTAKNAVKQSLFAAGGAFTGSFIAGPVGGLVGGIVGSIIGFVKGDDYDGLIICLTKLELERRKKLLNEVMQVLKVAGASAQNFQKVEMFKDVLLRYAEQDQVRNGIWSACINSARS